MAPPKGTGASKQPGQPKAAKAKGRKVSNREKAESKHYEFIAVRRIEGEDIPKWQRSGRDFTHVKHEGQHLGSQHQSRTTKRWQELGHPSGVNVLHSWSSSISDTKALARYTTFKGVADFSCFCDNIGELCHPHLGSFACKPI